MSTPNKKVPIHLRSSQNRLLLKHGKLVNTDGAQVNDIFIEDGIIKEIGNNLTVPGGTRVLEVNGMYVVPGGIDPHSFIGTNSTVDQYYDKTKAAISGGTTMIFEFAIPAKGESLMEEYEKVRTTADAQVCCDYSLHIGLSSWSEKLKEEIEILSNSTGINSFLLFLDESELLDALARCKELGVIPVICVEDGCSLEEIPSPLYISGLKGNVLSNIAASFKGETQVIGAVIASSKGIDIVTSSLNTVTSSSVRSQPSLDFIQLLVDGFSRKTGNEVYKKDDQEILKVIEDRMSIVWEKGVESGAMDPTQFVAVTSTNAARIFNLYPQKGCIAVGSDADIVVWNSSKTQQNSEDGITVHGVPEYVIVNGRICFEEGEIKAVQEFGRFISTPPFSPFLFSKHETSNKIMTNSNSQNLNQSSIKAHNVDNPPLFGDPNESQTTGKAARQEGQRNLLDSTFSISCEMDKTERRSCIRMINPPGGKSTGFW